MKRLKTILVPTDLSEHSRRAVAYGAWLAAEEKSSLVILHIANELGAWELYSEDLVFINSRAKAWPLDRVLAEASLDLNRFLELCPAGLKNRTNATTRVKLGPVPQQIVAVADEEKADLIIMAPRRHRGLRHLIFGGVTDRVTRLSPCPVLTISAPLPSAPWRGKSLPWFFSWSRPRGAEM